MVLFFLIIFVLVFIGIGIYARPNGKPINFTDRKELSSASLKELIIMIEKCPTFLLEKFRFELFYTKRIENKIISKAVYDKFASNFISREYYLALVEKCEKRDINEIPVLIEDFQLHKSSFLQGVHVDEIKEKLIFEVHENDTVELVAEPENAFDENAIRVDWKGSKIGYIPSGSAYDYHKYLKSEYKAFVYDIRYSNYDRIDCIISFYVQST